MNGMKGSLNSRLDRRSLFVFTKTSVLNLVLTLEFSYLQIYTSIMVFCFVIGTEIESVFEVEDQAGMSISKLKNIIYDKKKNNFEGKGFDPSDLHLWKVDIPDNTKNVKLKTLESKSHNINNENTIIQELRGRRLTPFESLGDIFDNDSKNIRIIAQLPTTESLINKRRLWYRDPKDANVIQDSSNKDQKIPVLESEFKRVREYCKLYVDKTEWLTRLELNTGEEYDINIDTDITNYDVKDTTIELITSLAGDDKNEYRQVVILINEYDSPLLNVIGITKENTKIANDSHSVKMYSHLGLFSGLNNLKDIILSDELSGAYGFTGDEITKAFEDKLSNLCKSDDHYRDVQDAMNRLQKKYN
ncbi:10676_t:CDS:2, partial [Funneliformis geosporum]